MPEQRQLSVEKLVYGGNGLSREHGRVTLTPLVLPGETIVAEAVDKLHARLIRVETPAPERVVPPCPYFGVCGGCHYQHAPYPYQVAQKVEILREVIRRIAKFEPPADIQVITGPEWNYRNRIQLHVRNGQIGYMRMGSHDMCPVDHCPISSPALNEAIRALSALSGDRRFPSFIRSVELFTNESEVQMNVLEAERPVAKHFFDWCASRIPGFAPGAIMYPAAAYTFRVGPRSFFQVNRFLTDRLVEEALRGACGDSALDLYAGVGLFSLPLGRLFRTVTAVESGASGTADLKQNAEAAGVPVEVVRSGTEEYLAGVEVPPDFVFADPPREGLGRKVVRELLRVRPSRLHIVACDPATLARDLQSLVQGGYQLERLVMADLFPQTYHIETIAFCSAA